MNKKGFTLVELLAVIAILALLVIIALPNVLSMFNNAKKDIFLTEAKSIYKEVSKKYISETMKGNKITKISSNGTKLDMDSNNLIYNISLDDKGNIKNFQVSDGTYCLSGKYSNLGELTTDKITEGKCENTEENNIAGTLKNDFYEKSGMDDKTIVKSISFYSDGRVIDSAESYDVSEEQNNSVKMYVKQNSENNSLYDISIVANGIIAFPEDSSQLLLFARAIGCGRGKPALEKINFNDAVDTSKVTNMSYMFAGGTSLTALDLSSFDTSNVTDMNCMFWQVDAEINFGNFDTSKVTDMSRMFYQSHTTTLDLSSFDTSNVTNMSHMFEDATSLKTIYISSKFNTNNVSSSSSMFSNCIKLVGGQGTTYDSTKRDKIYARIDGGTSNPGYFTAK